MKRLFVMFAMLFVFISLTACNENLDAYELLELSHNAQADLGSMIMEIDAQIEMTMMGMPLELPLTVRMEVENEERIQMDMNMSVMGMGINMSMFLRDGYMYSEMDMFGNVSRERSEIGINMNEAMEMIEMIDVFNASFIGEEMIEDSIAERIDDGYRLELMLNLDSIMSFLESMELVNEFLDFGETINEWNSVMILYINEDYLPISSELTMESESVTMNMTMTTTQLGNVIIDFPYWIDEISTSSSDSGESALLGHWQNGTGRFFIWVFGEADSVEFLEDGTLVIRESEHTSVVDWAASTQLGTFTADGDLFAYSIVDNTLTITDHSNDSWSFNR